MKCNLGCGKEAKFFFKNGKGYCESSPNKCEVKRKKDAEKKKGIFNGVHYWETDNPIYNPWNKGKKDELSDDYRNKLKVSAKEWWDSVDKESEFILQRNKNISNSMILNGNSGGLRKGGGRGKKGWYKGYWCDSSWELAWVIYHLEHKINFQRNTEGFEYEFKNKKRRYYPDFIIKNTYYEIKGRENFNKLDEQNKEKIKQFKKDIVILFKKDMKQYIEYTIKKYGKQYISLYENK